MYSGNSSDRAHLLFISFRMLEIVNTWAFKGTARLVLIVARDITVSLLQQPVLSGGFLGTPPLLRLSKSFVSFLPPLFLIQAIDT